MAMQTFARLLTVFLFPIAITASEPELRLLTGTVTDEFNRPIPGALVEWGHYDADSKDRESIRTGKNGMFRLTTRKYGPDFRLGASADGWGPRWRDSVIPTPMDSPKPYTLKLLKPVEVRGRVLDDYGKPIAGAVVIARSQSTGFRSSFSVPTPSYPFPGPAHEVTTGKDGSFVITSLPQQAATSFVAPRPAPNPATPQRHYQFQLYVRSGNGIMPRGTALPDEPVIIHVAREHATKSKGNGTLKARVFDQKSGSCITNFRTARRHIPGMIDHKDKLGQFSIDHLIVNRQYQVFVYADGYAPFELRERAGAATATNMIDCPLRPAPGLTAVVVDEENNPVAGARIVAGVVPQQHAPNRFQWDGFEKYIDGYMGWEKVQRTTTDSDGRFYVCENNATNALAILAPRCARQFLNAADRPKIGDDGVMTIQLQKECRLEALVTKDGEPESNARLRLVRKNFWELDFGQPKADRDGHFEIGQLQPGDYYFGVYQYSGGTGTTRLSRTIRISSGETLRIEMNESDGPFSLKGNAPPFALISLSAKGEQRYTHIGTVADVNGAYRIEGLHKGTYEISVRQPSALGGHIFRGRGQAIEIEGDSEYNAMNSVRLLFE